MHRSNFNKVDAAGLRIAMVVSDYHAEITGSMRDAAREAFIRAGGNPHSLSIVAAPGAFELTAICRSLACGTDRFGRGRFDGVVALACIITGETTHDQYIAQSVTQGLTEITIQSGVPIAFGVLTCQNMQQARARSIDAAAHKMNNKGAEAMIAAIKTARTIREIETSREYR